MKLYEAVKNRNIGKVYEAENGDKFKIIEVNKHAALTTLEDTSALLAITSEILTLEVKEVVNPVNPYERPAMGQKYYYISLYNRIEANYWSNSVKDNTLFNIANCYLTREEADKVAKGILHGRKILREKTINDFKEKTQTAPKTQSEQQEQSKQSEYSCLRANCEKCIFRDKCSTRDGSTKVDKEPFNQTGRKTLKGILDTAIFIMER